jgi:hypothetical protein
VKIKLDNTNGPNKTKIKLVQRVGITTAFSMIRSNIFRRKNFGRHGCILCLQGGENGGGGLGYIGEFVRFPEES